MFQWFRLDIIIRHQPTCFIACPPLSVLTLYDIYYQYVSLLSSLMPSFIIITKVQTEGISKVIYLQTNSNNNKHTPLSTNKLPTRDREYSY